MYAKLCTTLQKSFAKKLQILDKMSLPDYMKKIEELKAFNDDNPEDSSKEKQNILTPSIQKQRQGKAIYSILYQSGAYVTSANEDKSDKVGWFGDIYKYEEVQKALAKTNVPVYNKQIKDKPFESCISHGGYTLLQKETGDSSSSWVSNAFFKVKDKSNNVRIIQRVPFFSRKYKNQKKAMDHLDEQVKREFLDSTGRIKTLTDLGMIPKVHDYFVCFSERFGTNTAHIYIVQDYVENAKSLNEYIKENKDNLNKDALTEIMHKIEHIVKEIYAKTDYRYRHDYLHYSDFTCSLSSDKKTVVQLFLKGSETLQHKDVQEEQFEDQKKEREEREQKLLQHMHTQMTNTMRATESKQMDVAIMMMVQDNALGLPVCDKDIEIKRIVEATRRKSKVASRSSSAKKPKPKTVKKTKM